MTDDLPLFQHARARATDPGTSHEAADHVSRTTMKPSQIDVLKAIRKIGPCTQKDLETCHLRVLYSPSRIRTAVRELADAGKVTDTGEKTKLASGRKAIIWKAS
jgi:hypothetical protein